VAVPKIVGIETEYGVALRGAPDPNPVIASSLLINGYVEQHRVGWDFEDESPGRDARGFARDGAQPPEVETHLVNAVLTNGARYYVDHAHPEYSTPECSDPMQAVLFDKAGRAHPGTLDGRSAPAAAVRPGDRRLQEQTATAKATRTAVTKTSLSIVRSRSRHLYATSSPGSSRGRCSPAQARSVRKTAPTRSTFKSANAPTFSKKRSDSKTTLKRPIVNTRDEPHADPQKYRRLHVIVGDANLCEVATFLKVGATAIVLAMIEDGFIDKDLSISGPVPAMRAVSHDPTCRATVEVASLGRCSAIEMQWEFLRLARKYADESGLEACGGDEIGGLVLDRWEQVLTTLERDPSELDGQLDWVTKSNLLRAYVDRDKLSWTDPKLSLLDLQYHDVRPARSLYERLVRAGKVERLLDEPAVRAAMVDPPETTRAYFRGTCLARWADSVVAAKLGQPGPRRRQRPVAEDPNDGAHAW